MNDIPSFNRTDFLDLGSIPGVRGREPDQHWWHPWIAGFICGMSVIEVGCGVSTFKADAMKAGAKSVVTQDPCEWCNADLKQDIGWLADEGIAWDAVVATDVIEHVVNYGRFARDTVRIAKKLIVITTPGGGVTYNQNPHHYHEFLPNELVQLFEAAGAMLRTVRFYGDTTKFSCEAGKIQIDATGDAARKLAADRVDVHPLGFVFRVGNS